MKVGELLKTLPRGEKVAFVDISKQEYPLGGKPKAMILTNGFAYYMGMPISDYNVENCGRYETKNFDFLSNVFLGAETPKESHIVVIDIDSKKMFELWRAIGGRTSVGKEIDVVTKMLTDVMLARHQTPINTQTTKPLQIQAVGFGMPDQVQFNDEKKVTTLIYHGSTREDVTIVKASKDEQYSRRVGFLEAFFQANCGLSKNKALKYLKELENLPSVGKKKEKAE